MTKKLMLKQLASMLASFKRKKKYYCEVEYLENTETGSTRNWINTEIPADPLTTKWEVRVAFNDTNTGKLMGSGYAGSTRFNLGIESNKFRFGFATSWFDANASVSTPDTNPHVWSLDATTKTGTIDGYSATSTAEFGVERYPIALFGRANGATSTENSNTVVGKIYYTKIWQNDVLVRDMIPVLDWNYVPCMYDKVSDELFYNQGTGNFSYGREIHYVDYLESTGTQWIDTGVSIDTSTDIIDFDFELIDTNLYKWFFGEYDENARIGLGSGDGEAKRNFLYQQSATKVKDSEMYGARHNFYADQIGAYLNGTKIRSYVSFASTSTIYLFNINISSESDYKCAAKVYRYKQYRNNALIRDFIPAIDENGIGFLFDRVTHNIFDNSGTGAFNYPVVELEYIESSGEQYIDTGYKPVPATTKFEFYFSPTNISGNYFLFGARPDTSAASSYTCTAYFSSGAVRQDWAGISASFPATSVGNKYLYTAYNNTVSLNTDTVTGTNTRSTARSDYNFLLFTVNTGGAIDTRMYIGRVYYTKLWDDSTLVRNLIPCYKDGQAGMWDKVNSMFYGNGGTGNFVVGKIKESEYLE